jgi:transposase
MTTYATLMTGPERRRRWSEYDRRRIVAEAFAPGAVVTRVARANDVSTALIYKWRAQARAERGLTMFAPVVVANEPAPMFSPTPPEAAAEPVSAAIVVELPGGARVRIGAAASPALVAATLRGLGRGLGS